MTSPFEAHFSKVITMAQQRSDGSTNSREVSQSEQLSDTDVSVSVELSEEDLASVAGGSAQIGGRVWGGAAVRRRRELRLQRLQNLNRINRINKQILVR